MNKTLEYFVTRYSIDLNQPSPIKIGLTREWGLLRSLYKLGFKYGAEVGVYEGLFSARICRMNPQMKLYCIDSWENYPEYQDYHLSNLAEAYITSQKRLESYNTEIIKDYSMNAVQKFADGELDFVYIDAAHDFNHVYEDIREWSKKVRSGGIIAGHDYGNRRHYGVVKAITRWIRRNKIHPLFLTGHNTTKSWFYVKT